MAPDRKWKDGSPLSVVSRRWSRGKQAGPQARSAGGQGVSWSRCRCGRSGAHPPLAGSSLLPTAAALWDPRQPLFDKEKPWVSPSPSFPPNKLRNREAVVHHLSRQTAAGPPGPRGTRRSPVPGPPEAGVYIYHSSSCSSSTGNSRSSSRWPGRRTRTEPAGGQRHDDGCVRRRR